MNTEQKLDDSGLRDQFETGAVREVANGRGRYDLISVPAMYRVAMHYENGAAKYSERNWEKGIPISNCINSLYRHLLKYIDGETSEDHMAAIAWNVFAIMHYETRNPNMQDLPTRREEDVNVSN
jgi:hypothetical protein